MSTDFGFNATNEPPYYFVSYNTEDSERIAEICRLLNEKGLPIWYDEGIPHDSYWEGVIVDKIFKCEEVIFFITKGIFEKGKTRNLDELFTYIEYDYAIEYRKKKLIVLLDEISDVPLSMMPWWRKIKPSTKQGVVGYGEPPEEVTRKILKELHWEKNKPLSFSDDISYPVFNSVVDHPLLGDEREFIHIREGGTQEWKRKISLKAGKQYEVEVFFRNDGNPAYNSKGSVIARGAVMSIFVPQFVPSLTGTSLSARITHAQQGKSQECVDFITLQSDQQYGSRIKYVLGQAKIYNNWKANESVLSSHLFEPRGTPLGLNELQGLIPAGDDFSGKVRFYIDVEDPISHENIAISTEASIDGTTWHSSSIQATQGSYVFLKITVQNNSTQALATALFKVKLLEVMSIERATLITNRFPKGYAIDEEQFLLSGVEISANSKSMVQILLQLKINNAGIGDALSICPTLYLDDSEALQPEVFIINIC